MCEDTRPHIEHQSFADAKGSPPLNEQDRRVGDRKTGHHEGKTHHKGGVAAEDAAIDDLPVQERIEDADDGLDGHQHEEDDQSAAIRPEQSEHPASRSGCDLLRLHRGVTLQGL